MRKWMLLLVPLLVIAFNGQAHSAVYCYVDENGVTHFSDRPKTSKYKRFKLWDNERIEDEAPIASSFDHIIREASAKYRVDPAMIKAMIRVESNFNPNAVSPKGAMGLMQLMPATAARLKVSDPFNSTENIWAGVYYVKCLILKYDYNYDLVFAAYNAGENAVAKYNGVPPYRETQGYVKKVNKYWKKYQGQFS